MGEATVRAPKVPITPGAARDPKKLCTAHRSNGEPCHAYAIRGGNVCPKHGGSTPQVRKAAMRRLHAASDWLMAELLEIARSAESEAVRLAAIRDALDRAGYKPDQVVRMELEADWHHTFDGLFEVVTTYDD